VTVIDRRRRTVVATAGLAVALLVPPGDAGASSRALDGAYWTNCPKPESLVFDTDWHTKWIAPGVVLQEGRRHDRNGYVKMHVLRVDVTNQHLGFRPLMRKIAARNPLSKMARRQHRLVAATNAGYFNYGSNSPIGPVIDRGRALLASSRPESVVGFGHDGLMQAGEVQLVGQVRARGQARTLAGLNVAWPRYGLNVYTPRWGSHPVVRPQGSLARYVSGRGRVVSPARHRYRQAPRHGFLLVARGSADRRWLRTLHQGTRVDLARHLTTDAPRPFRLGYAVGTQIVLPGGYARLGLSCRRSYPQPARTGIGFANGGRELILTVVGDNHYTALHGLSSIQLARVMSDLGADQAFLLDGGGSTEMLARMARGRRLTLRNHPTDGRERPLPLGFAIYRR
jgi:hypothetical protein